MTEATAAVLEQIEWPPGPGQDLEERRTRRSRWERHAIVRTLPVTKTSAQSAPRFVDAASASPAAHLLGGKAARLAELGKSGLPVPPWFCVTTEVYRELTAAMRADIDAALAGLNIDDRPGVARASARLAERVRSAVMGAADRQALLDSWDALFAADARVAVRSSVVGEDSANASFAGQMDTYLHVTREQLVERVLDCFASAFSERALAYRLVRGQTDLSVDAAVLVQLMVDSRSAGVLFTANPTTGVRGEVVISAGLGLGEGVVSGIVDTDTYYLDLRDGKVAHADVVAKPTRVAFDSARGAGTRIEDVPAAEAARAALGADELGVLCTLARKIDGDASGAPQDIEWAVDQRGKVHILQARPITTLGRGRESIFDNANIVESYPGLILPLTFSFARKGYEIIFRENSILLGCTEEFLRPYSWIYENMVGLVDGRLYYNILNWYAFFQVIPGFDWILPAWEKALGLKRLARPAPRSGAKQLTLLYFRARIIVNGILNGLLMDSRIRGFFREFQDAQRSFAARRLEEMSAHELIDLTEEQHLRLSTRYAISPLNDSWAQQMHELVGKLIARWRLGDPINLRNELLCGEEGMESVAPVRSIVALAETIRADETLRRLFASDTPPLQVWQELQRAPQHARLRAQLDEHLRMYGDRMLQELKLDTLTFEDDPSFVVVMLRNYLAGGQDNAGMRARELEQRARAETQVRKCLWWRPLRRTLFGWALRRLRHSVRDRENLRFARSRAVGMTRRIYRELGRQLAKAGLIADARDIHYLTTEEVADLVRGQSVIRDAREVVALRMRDYEVFATRRPDPRVTTYGIVYANEFSSPEASQGSGPTGVLRGTGCSPGSVTAVAKVVQDPRSDLEVRGEILVAPSTDPGWVFLMVAAAGLVAERGSLLSHTAIIGRELGIPTVVGVKDATRLIRSGQRIVLDGVKGTVEVLPEPGAAAPPADVVAADQSVRP